MAEKLNSPIVLPEGWLAGRPDGQAPEVIANYEFLLNIQLSCLVREVNSK